MLAVKFKLGSKPETHFRVTKSCQTSPCAYLHGLCERKNLSRNPNPKPVGQNPSSNLAYPCARCGSNIAKCKGSGRAAATADSHVAVTAPTPVCSRPKERLECKPNPPNRGTKPWQTSSRPHRVLLNFISRTRHLWKTILKSSMPPAGDFRLPTVGLF